MRVLIVDDHTLVRAGIGRLLQALPDVDVVAEASNAQQALDMAEIHRPDLILLDLSLPDRSGLDLLPLLRESLPQTRVVMMSMHNDPTQVVGPAKFIQQPRERQPTDALARHPDQTGILATSASRRPQHSPDTTTPTGTKTAA